jgi:spermidine/putrescine transport system permease protein
VLDSGCHPKIEVINGRLTTRRGALWRGALAAVPGFAWLLVFLVLPLTVIGLVCLIGTGEYGRLDLAAETGPWHRLDVTVRFTTENLARAVGFSSFGWAWDHVLIVARTLWIAGVTTALCIAIGYPLAFWTASFGPRGRAVLLALVMVPFCTNLVIRTYALREVVGSGSVAVYLGMVAACLPFAALPLYTSVERLDWRLVEAARDLYASRLATFRHAILPQTAPGLLAALILTFIPGCGMFLVTDLLNNGRTYVVGNLIQTQLNRDMPLAACLSMGLIALTLVGLWAMRRWARDELGH